MPGGMAGAVGCPMTTSCSALWDNSAAPCSKMFLSPCPGCLSRRRSLPHRLVLSRENPLWFPDGIRMLDTCVSPCCFWQLDTLT